MKYLTNRKDFEDNVSMDFIKFQSKIRDFFIDLFIEIEVLEKENEALKNRIEELEELLKISKERD